ncbi:MAG: hypothetical protein BGO09_08420 [Bacteroidetes bacterium 47-18]|nr:MAG: hypothetical protein BGO09_08420 [Bacteroidetes bacterium 47-18]
MKRKYFVLLPLLILAACNKDNKKQYSTWYVNGEMFRTNDVGITEGKVKHIFNSKDIDNKFYIELRIDLFSIEGDYLFDCSYPHPMTCCMVINYKHVSYINVKSSSYLRGNIYNKKCRYTLNPTWFYNESDANDSILVKGEFNEP